MAVEDLTIKEKAQLAFKLDSGKIKNTNKQKFLKNYVNGFFFRLRTENFLGARPAVAAAR